MAVVEQGQSLMDMAVQHSGDATGLFEIARRNGISMTAELAVGTDIEIPGAHNEEIKQWFADGGNVVATENPLPAAEAGTLEGIGYWTIGLDFIVS